MLTQVKKGISEGRIMDCVVRPPLCRETVGFLVVLCLDGFFPIKMNERQASASKHSEQDALAMTNSSSERRRLHALNNLHRVPWSFAPSNAPASLVVGTSEFGDHILTGPALVARTTRQCSARALSLMR